MVWILLSVDQIADARGIQRHAIDSRAERTQRILDGVGDGGWYGKRASFARTLDASD